MNTTTINGITFHHTSNDIYGNPRYIVHFPAFIGKMEHNDKTILQRYGIAAQRAKRAGFKKYRGKSFGGGFVCQSYSLTETAKRIKELHNTL